MQTLSESERAKLSIEVPKLVGQQIVAFRNLRNLTQTELAAMVGKDRQYLYKIEKGRVTPNIATLSIIASALKITLSELFEKVEL
ncbi:helix-turn-helix domain-containing protein [Flavobacterium psychrophilum]|uniref:helix-turn-helix domain-containing protein n=1 Tax=Flavobacterium psychrophilum TaxID=96345 RepID=UPI000B7C53F6|nr:helix-turn-helix transcriptional regulator [Flavobacterium psychrophilum]MBF2024385.1 helix-turn-helix transcriptional regulator [Flavobacterium psychrophilum]MCB5984135.1 helix-turn-helix domain-containing protein [Flavobacterium psychrophilum]MCB5994122.1 helix-turn-helix domain-containing protein [Flavobacterium psychrophilum]MCB5997054.1 helix-turn-helix domain-containing protein [Flavobacterium psychrophilum]MCB6004399.1 helix-turn-helix domain-containing protein [Flavobacterium psychr